MPSLARVMPVISVFIGFFSPFSFSFTRFLYVYQDQPRIKSGAGFRSKTRWLVGRRAILGVTVTVILEYLLDNLGLEFTIRAFCDLGQVKILDRITVAVEFEPAAQRGEVGLLQCGGHRFLVGKVALYRLDGAVDQHRRVIGLEGIGAGHNVVGGLIGGDEFLVLRIVEIGRPVRAAEHADCCILLRRQRRFIDRERRKDWNLIGEAGLLVLLHQG